MPSSIKFSTKKALQLLGVHQYQKGPKGSFTGKACRPLHRQSKIINQSRRNKQWSVCAFPKLESNKENIYI